MVDANKLEERIEYLRSDPEVLDDIAQSGDNLLQEKSVAGLYKMLALMGDVETPMLGMLCEGTICAEWQCVDVHLIVDVISEHRIYFTFIKEKPVKQRSVQCRGKMADMVAELKRQGVIDFLCGDACAKFAAAWKQGRDLRDGHKVKHD